MGMVHRRLTEEDLEKESLTLKIGKDRLRDKETEEGTWACIFADNFRKEKDYSPKPSSVRDVGTGKVEKSDDDLRSYTERMG